MAKINILDKSIYNRIAAGEVVERPYSIVKECVENALDAGATSIVVDIKSGGIKNISIIDNGDGIEYDCLHDAFLPHATSKISKIEDLDSIETLGFRGEALASIGSVAQVTLRSKYKESDVGGEIEVNGGVISKPKYVGVPQGTHISVNNLFYNVPARAKFLKSPKTEEGYITNIMARFILANPSVTFKYIADGRTVYQTVGKTLKDAIYVVYGRETIDNLLEIDHSIGNYHVTGYVSKPVYAKPNRTYQTLIINHRYVVNMTVSQAVQSSFENYLMKGRFPMYVLNLTLPNENVDVNVHPNKLDVRFEEQSKIFALFTNAVAKALLASNGTVQAEIKPVENTSHEPLPMTTGKSFLDRTTQYGQSESSKSFSRETPAYTHTEQQPETNIQNIPVIKPQYGNQEPQQEQNALPEIQIKKPTDEFVDFRQQKDIVDYMKQKGDLASVVVEQVKLDKVPEAKSTLSQNKVVGVAFNTYIFVENDNDLYIIDQHAAHERLLYDKFLAEYNNKTLNTQDLLIPYVFTVNALEDNFLREHISEFGAMGFNMVEFGKNTYKISSSPVALGNVNFKDFIADIVENMSYISKDVAGINTSIATSACKAAIKGGQPLNNTEIDTLINNLNSSKTTMLCPHGRPLVVKLKKADLEKWFKRIV